MNNEEISIEELEEHGYVDSDKIISLYDLFSRDVNIYNLIENIKTYKEKGVKQVCHDISYFYSFEGILDIINKFFENEIYYLYEKIVTVMEDTIVPTEYEGEDKNE